MGLILFIAATAAYLYAKYFDIKSSIEMTKYGITESQPMFADENGFFSPVKGWTAVLIYMAVVIAIYFVLGQFVPDFPNYATALVYAPSALLSVLHGQKNYRYIEKVKETRSA